MKFSWSTNQWRLLSRNSAGTTSSTCYHNYHKYGPRRLLYFSAGQCASPQSQINHQNAKKRLTRLHSSHIMAFEQSRLNPVDYKVWSVMQ